MRVAIAEDSAILRDGLASLLSRRGHEIAVAAADGETLLAEVTRAERPPDVAVLDVRMPPTFTDEGLRAALRLRRDRPGIGVLLFSQYIETRYAQQLLAGDASGVGYLLKDRVADVRSFIDALERLRAGDTVLDPEVVTQLMSTRSRAGELARLTPREHEVLDLMAQGRSNAAIASTLATSSGSVEKHITAIFGKLGLPPAAGDSRRVLAVLRYLGLDAASTRDAGKGHTNPV